MQPLADFQTLLTRRQMLAQASCPLGAIALGSLLGTLPALNSAHGMPPRSAHLQGGLPELPHFAPTAKRVIYLFMAGGPSQIDTFDYHPEMRELHGKELPASVRMGQRITGMTSGQSTFPVAAPVFKFERHGRHGTWVSELFPHVATIVDDIAIVKSLHTEAINHDPAITFINTGASSPAKPVSVRGSATAWAARTRTCPRTSCSCRTGPGSGRPSTVACGAAVSCRRSIRA